MKKELEIITLIYKSVDYLNFIYKQLNSKVNKAEGWKIKVRIIANDATDEVIKLLCNLKINRNIYRDKNPDDYYLNRVYRCWNYAVESSECENVCLVNSDMAFSPGWIESLLRYDLYQFIPCSRLVESGKMLSGDYAIVKDFGKNPKEFKQEEWLDFAAKKTTGRLFSGGLYMPCVFNRKRFIKSGGYPEGNLYEDNKIGSLNGKVIKSGDAYFFENTLAMLFEMKHITDFNSLIYHIQEGEFSSDD